MPTVLTIEGARSGKQCKRTKRNPKTGCTILVCKSGKRWKFQKGTSQCR